MLIITSVSKKWQSSHGDYQSIRNLKKEKVSDLLWTSMSGIFSTETSKSKKRRKEMQRMKGK